MNEAPAYISPRLHPVEVGMERLDLSRSTVYTLIRSGHLRSVKVGKRRLVPESALAEFIERLESEPPCPRTGLVVDNQGQAAAEMHRLLAKT